MSLTRLAITRPVTILMLVLALVIMGLQSRGRLPVDLYPDVEFPMLYISTVYAGTGPEEMETLVSKPIEDTVSTISGLKKLSSTSAEGVSNVIMEFEIGTDLDVAASDVRSKLDALRNTLPADADAPIVNKVDIGALPVLQLSAASDRRPSQEVRRIADDLVKDRLSQITGVAAVNISGGDVREIRVEVDKARLEAYGLSIAQVVNAIQMENLNLPSGTVKEERRNFAVRVMGEFTSPEQLYDVRLASASDPNLTLRDVATVQDTLAEPEIYTRLNRGPSVSIVVQKQSDANTVKVAEQVRKELGKLTGRDYTEADEGLPMDKGKMKAPPLLPPDYAITVGFDQSIFIKDSLDDVNKSLVEGALLAIIIVFLFLHSLRGTLIVGLAIPTSLISTFLVMQAFGFSINMMSMLGLSLCVGILVDDSIVVIENIHRHLRKGEPPREAAINGRSEIGLAAITITMVDVVVFVPIAFMGGIVGQFFRQFGVVIAAATLFSLFVSFTLTPMLASRWLKPHEEEEAEEERQREHPDLFHRFVNAWERGYGAVDRLYRVVLAWALDHRVVVICLGFMTMLGSFATAVGKPKLDAAFSAALPKASGILLVAMLVVVLIIWGISHTNGWLRVLLTALGVPAGIALIVNANTFAWLNPKALEGLTKDTPAYDQAMKMAGQKAVGEHMFIVFIMCMLALAVTAYFFSRPNPRGTTWNAGLVTGPVLIWTTVLLFVLFVVPTKFTFEFQPRVDERQFSITVEQEVGTPLEVTNATVKYIEEALFDKKRYPDTKVVSVSVGSSGGGMMSAGGSGADIAQIDVELNDLDDLKHDKGPRHVSALDSTLIQFGLMKNPVTRTDDMIAQVNKEFANLPGVEVTAAVQEGGPGGAPITIEVSGPDMRKVQAAANRVADVVRQPRYGTFATKLSWREGRPELQARIDRDRAAQYGISVSQIASTLRTSLEGDTSTKYREGGKEYDIRVILPRAQRDYVSQVPNLLVGTTPEGRPVSLYEVVELTPAGGPTKIERTNRQRSVTITAQLREGYAIGNVRQQLTPEIDKLHLADVNLVWAGQAEAMDDSFANMNSALLLSIALVFMLMAALFESLLSPLIIMLSVPQAMAGAIFALTLTHKSLSIVSMIGIIMLVGLVTKNAILMVDYTNTLRKEQGKDRRAALLEAGPTRLQPILMTTLAMIFGMMPTAIALSKGSEFRQPMAITVIGGLILSLFLTLVMVPCFYEVMDNISQRLFGRRRKSEPMPEIAQEVSEPADA